MAQALPAGRHMPLDCEQTFIAGSQVAEQHWVSDAQESPISLHAPPPPAAPPVPTEPPVAFEPPVPAERPAEPAVCTLASGFELDPPAPPLPPGPAAFSPPHFATMTPVMSKRAALMIRLIIGESLQTWIVATIRFLTGHFFDQAMRPTNAKSEALAFVNTPYAIETKG